MYGSGREFLSAFGKTASLVTVIGGTTLEGNTLLPNTGTSLAIKVLTFATLAAVTSVLTSFIFTRIAIKRSK